MNEQSLPQKAPASQPRRTLHAAVTLVVAAILFFVVRVLDGINSAFGAFAGSVDHSPFLYVSIIALFIVAFITHRIGRWHGFISTLLFTGFVAWVCWAAAADIARGYQTGWQDYAAQQWLSIQRRSLIWGLVFAVVFCILPLRQTNSNATGIA
jgi:hypothetical protein